MKRDKIYFLSESGHVTHFPNPPIPAGFLSRHIGWVLHATGHPALAGIVHHAEAVGTAKGSYLAALRRARGMPVREAGNTVSRIVNG
jgi:hypothetical protein